MARKQTRRSVSIKGTTHGRIKAHVKGGSVAGFVEDLLLEKFGPPTDEDRKKFGKLMEQREKDSTAEKAAKDPDEPQIQELPKLEFEPIAVPEPKPETEPVPEPKPETEPVPEPKPETEPVPEPERASQPEPKKRILSKGTSVSPKVEEEDDSELEDYIPAILFF